MIVVMKAGSSEEELKEVTKGIEELGYKPHIMRGVERNVIGCLGDERGKSQLQGLEILPGVEKVMPILSPYKLAGKQLKPEPSVIEISDKCKIGGDNIAVVAGPCSVESEEQIVSVAKSLAKAGANALRGGAFKPRSSTYSFQGLGEEGLKLLKLAKEETGLPIVTEVLDHYMIDLVAQYADVLQVGARNMMNFSLLKALGEVDKPIFLKRGMMATVEELLMASEYILSAGNPNVILCERGIRTFETATRNTLDLNAVPALQARTHLPVVVDPSHGTGIRDYIAPMAKASIAAGASGLMIEVHPEPEKALSDGPQSLVPEDFATLMKELKPLAKALGKSIGTK